MNYENDEGRMTNDQTANIKCSFVVDLLSAEIGLQFFRNPN